MAALAGLSTARLGLQELLTRVASFAVQAIPGADGASIILLEPDHTDITATSQPFVRPIDDIQHSLGEGPGISAAATGQTMRSGSLNVDRRWPRFGPQAGRLGVHSALSLPLLTNEGEVLGAMSIYAHRTEAIDDRAEHIGQLFAEAAAITVHNGQILAQTQRLAANLQTAVTNQASINQAVGIIISRTGTTADDAVRKLRTLSQRDQLELSAGATKVVDEAVRRARARRHPGRR